MTRQEQNILIAKAHGWTCIRNANTMACGGVWQGYPPVDQMIGHPDDIPDYFSDLNAIHEAEKVIVNGDKETCSRWLIALQSLQLAGLHATAEERSTIFIKTLNLLK